MAAERGAGDGHDIDNNNMGNELQLLAAGNSKLHRPG